jgi:hypothetical protein
VRRRRRDARVGRRPDAGRKRLLVERAAARHGADRSRFAARFFGSERGKTLVARPGAGKRRENLYREWRWGPRGNCCERSRPAREPGAGCYSTRWREVISVWKVHRSSGTSWRATFELASVSSMSVTFTRRLSFSSV